MSENKLELRFINSKEFGGPVSHITANSHEYDFDYKNNTYRVTFVTNYINYELLYSLLNSGVAVEKALEDADWGNSEIIIETEDEDGDLIPVTGSEYDELANLLKSEFENILENEHDNEVDRCHYYLDQIEEEEKYSNQ